MEPIRVLLVEDNEDSAEALCMILEIEGFQVRWTRTGHEALMALASDQGSALPVVDVALLDLMLPDMSGVKLAQEIAARGAAPPLVLYSAASEADLRAAASQIHAVATVRKPCDCRHLARVLREVAAKPPDPLRVG